MMKNGRPGGGYTPPSAIPGAPPKMPKGQFKCFHCRKAYASKEGDWFVWNTMEVHLCKTCDRATATRVERKKSK